MWSSRTFSEGDQPPLPSNDDDVNDDICICNSDDDDDYDDNDGDDDAGIVIQEDLAGWKPHGFTSRDLI